MTLSIRISVHKHIAFLLLWVCPNSFVRMSFVLVGAQPSGSSPVGGDSVVM